MTTIELKKQERNISIKLNHKLHNDITEKRYFVAELIKKALDKYLDFDDMNADNSYSIYTLPLVNEELNIIDFEINSLSVHVVSTIDRIKNENVYIPKIYQQFHYAPDIILFVNFTKSFTKMDILGFITDIDLKQLTINKNSLISADNLIETLQNTKPKAKETSSNIINTTKELILAYIDNDLSDDGKRFFLKHLIQNKEVRKNYKIFYSLNCEFISIAKNSGIEKTNPFEWENKINLQSRSDYLIDKAISKYEVDNHDEQEENVEEEIIEEEPTLLNDFKEENNNEKQEETTQNNEENIIELSLDSITKTEPEIVEPEIVEPIQETTEIENPEIISNEIINNNDIDVPQDTEIAENNFENNNTELQNENEIENITENTDNNLDDFSLNNEEEAIDLSQMELGDDLLLDINNNELENIEEINPTEDNEHPIQNEQPIEKNTELSINNIELEPEVAELINDISDDELAEIAIDDDELTAMLSEDIDDLTEQGNNTEIPEIQTQEIENSTQETVAEGEGEEEDLFAFLSEISDENNTDINEETNSNQTVTNIPNEQFEQSNNNEINQVIENDFAQEQTPPQENFQTEYIPPAKPKQKSNSKLIVGTMLIIGLLGAGVYVNKDLIKQKLGLSSKDEFQDLALDNGIPLPPATGENIQGGDVTNTATTNSDTKPTPPDTTKNNEAVPNAATNIQDNNQIPVAKDAPTLPQLPSTTVEPPKAKHINDAIATALSKDFNGVRISKVSWEASETLVNNPDVKRYLTITGKSIKNALSQDLLSATEPSFKDNVIITITYKKDGTVFKTDITSSSGSSQIDNIIKKSVEDTLKYVKMPNLNIAATQYSVKLLIRL